MISVSGTLRTGSGSVAPSGSLVRFWCRGCRGNQPFVSGTALVAPNGGSTYYVDFASDATTGAVSGSLYSTSEISVGGSTGVIYYGMQVNVNGIWGVESAVDASANININAPTLLSVAPVVASPTGDGTYGRLDGANGAFATISAKHFENERYADQFTGANVAAQINAAITDCGANPSVVVIPSSMGAGSPTTPIPSNIVIIDYRTSGKIGLWFGGDSAANFLSRFTSSPGTVGFLDLNNGLHIHSSLDISSGSITMRQPGSYVAFHNGNFNLAETTGKYGFVQAGDTTSGNPAWNANNTLTLPDLAQGGGSDASGYLLGAATAQLTSGNGLYASAGSGAGAGCLNDSGIGFNTHVDFPSANNRFVRWKTGGFALALTGNSVSADRTATLPDASGNVVLDTATQTLSGKTFSDSVTVQSANGAQWIRGQSSELLTLSTSGTTTDTSANLLPANSIIEAVVARITTTITTATDWKLGDATQAARFTAANATLTSGTTTVGLLQADPTVATANLGPVQTSAAKIRVTTTGTPGAGAIRITCFYRQFVAPTS